MSRKFVFIGAGSLDFTRHLVRDLLTFKDFDDCEISLVDINEKRLAYAYQGIMKIIQKGKYHAKVTYTTDRRAALVGADGVVITILQGGVEVWRHDIEIPKKYGVDINVGDTRGPSGIFRFLRTAPVMLDIIRDVEELCPHAIVLNYSNPMAMLVSYLQKQTFVNVTGLCHSVQGTAEMLAEWIGADIKDIKYVCAGINHQAFYTEYKWNNEDAYPLLKEAILREEIANYEPVRIEMFKHLGYFPTESSGHNSEYNQWFRKRPDLIEKYCTYGTGWNPGEYAYILNEYLERETSWESEYKEWLEHGDIDLERGEEYASNIFNAILGDHTPFFFNGNLQNKGYIKNVREDACVEVPVVATERGVHSTIPVTLPEHLALMVDHSARIEELAVQAAITGDPIKVFHAILFDPLTSSVLSMQEIKDMVQEMLQKNAEYLTYFKSLSIDKI